MVRPRTISIVTVKPGKFVSIAASTEGAVAVLFALDENGHLWKWSLHVGWIWMQPPHPIQIRSA